MPRPIETVAAMAHTALDEVERLREMLKNVLWEYKKTFERGQPYAPIIVEAENILWGFEMKTRINEGPLYKLPES